MWSAPATDGPGLAELCLILICDAGTCSMNSHIGELRRAVMSAKYFALLRRQTLLLEDWSFRTLFLCNLVEFSDVPDGRMFIQSHSLSFLT